MGAATIAEILRISLQRARLVEAYLRLAHSTIGHLSRVDIHREYRTEIGPAIDADPALAERLAASFGLVGG